MVWMKAFLKLLSDKVTLKGFVAVGVLWLLANIVGFLSVADAMSLKIDGEYANMFHTIIGGLLVCVTKIIDYYFGGKD